MIKLYEYYNVDSVIHRMNPIVKLCWVVAITFLVFSTASLRYLLLIFAIMLLSIIISKVPFRMLTDYLKVLLFFIIATYLMVFLLSWASFYIGSVFLIKIIILILAVVLFSLTTSKKEFLISLIKMKIPYSFAFALMIAIRFLPTMLKEVKSVVAVQRTRCHRMTFNILKPFESVRSYTPIIIPSFIIIFKRAFELFLSAESRGFTPRTYERKKLPVCFGDVLAVSFLLFLVVGSYFL